MKPTRGFIEISNCPDGCCEQVFFREDADNGPYYEAEEVDNFLKQINSIEYHNTHNVKDCEVCQLINNLRAENEKLKSLLKG